MLPLLTIIADFIGLIGGVSDRLDHDSNIRFRSIGRRRGSVLEYNDMVQGLLKPFLFAIIIALVGCFYGMRTSGRNAGSGPRHHQGRGRVVHLDFRDHVAARSAVREFSVETCH